MHLGGGELRLTGLPDTYLAKHMCVDNNEGGVSDEAHHGFARPIQYCDSSSGGTKIGRRGLLSRRPIHFPQIRSPRSVEVDFDLIFFNRHLVLLMQKN